MSKEVTNEALEALTSPLRPKRRAAKVDYSEKRSDFDFDHKNNGTEAGRASTVKEPTSTKKRKQGSTANTVGPLGSHSQSPVPEVDTSSIPWNYQPEIKNSKFSNLLNLEGAVVKNKLELVLKDGYTVKKDETIYLICEPPGEPYYIGRIMGFVKKNAKNEEENPEKTDKPATRNSKQLVEPAEEYMFKINWWYRSRDISKKSSDSRLLYATMHSDKCPLQSFRGKCIVQHKDEIEDFEQYKATPNQFWFERFFDRYMIKFYDVVPTSLLSGLPPNYQKALQKRFPYIFVEQGKSRDMLESPKSCVKCNQWSSHSDSIECCECGDFYHMLCLDPPLLKKPARGFAWSCIKCTKLLENNKMIPNEDIKKNSETFLSDNETNERNDQQPTKSLPSYEEAAIAFLEKDSALDFEDRRNLEEWNYRYLGMHAKLEDALDLQDRPYPRAASRLGPKHQFTNCPDWFDHKVVYYDTSELPEEYQRQTPAARGKKKADGRRKRQTQSEEAEEIVKPLKLPQEYKDTDPDEFPGWLQERPKGYIERGGDDTAELQWTMPEDETKASSIDEYVKSCDQYAENIGLLPTTPNFQDAILKNLLISEYDFGKAMGLNALITKATLKEPELTPLEIKKFEEGVKKYGSELWPVTKEIKTAKHSMVVRYYYLWKKTPNGRLIWGNYEGRRKNRSHKREESDTEDDHDIANDADDSSYDIDKSHKRELCCKHCQTRDSKQWYRAPGGHLHPDNNPKVIFALCQRCARLWRRYAVIWEDPNEVMKKTGQIKGGNGWKKKVEYELMVDADLIVKARSESPSDVNVIKKKSKQPSVEPPTPVVEEVKEKEKKAPKKKEYKYKYTVEKKEPKKSEEKPVIVVSNILNTNSDLHQAIIERYYHSTSPHYNSKLKFKDSSFLKSPLVSHSSGMGSFHAGSKLQKNLPTYNICTVCISSATSNNSLLCLGCGARVHPACYGVDHENVKDALGSYKWLCDPCSNALNPLASEDYTCIICNDEEEPNEPIKAGMKRTSEGQWIHILCALFASNIKFGDLTTLQPALNISSYVATCMRHGKEDKSSMKCIACSTKVDYKKLLAGDVFQVGFKFREDSKPDSKSVKITNSFGKVYPVVSCKGHGDTQILPLNSEAKRYKQSGTLPLLQIYLEDYKKSTNSSTGAQLRYGELMDSVNVLNNVKVEDEHYCAVSHQCSRCLATKTLKWIKSENGTVCYTCHSSSLQNEPSNNRVNGDVEMQDAGAITEEEQLPFGRRFSEVLDSSLDGSNYGIKDITERVFKPVELSNDFKLTPAVFERLKGDYKGVEDKLPEPKNSVISMLDADLESVANAALQRFNEEIVVSNSTASKNKMSIGNILG